MPLAKPSALASLWQTPYYLFASAYYLPYNYPGSLEMYLSISFICFTISGVLGFRAFALR